MFSPPVLVGCSDCCIYLQLNNRLNDGSVIYTVTPESHVVLEPFRLVSVTEAVEAAGCIRFGRHKVPCGLG